MKKHLIIACIAAIMAAAACKKDNGGTSNNNNHNDTIVPPRVVLEDTLCRSWIVDKSTHNGTNDPGTVGLNMEFYKDGTYKLVTTGYWGTWEFTDNKTKLLIDKNDSKFKTTWTINKLSAKQFNVTFISPFSGGTVYWEMKPF